MSRFLQGYFPLLASLLAIGIIIFTPGGVPAATIINSVLLALEKLYNERAIYSEDLGWLWRHPRRFWFGVIVVVLLVLLFHYTTFEEVSDALNSIRRNLHK